MTRYYCLSHISSINVIAIVSGALLIIMNAGITRFYSAREHFVAGVCIIEYKFQVKWCFINEITQFAILGNIYYIQEELRRRKVSINYVLPENSTTVTQPKPHTYSVCLTLLSWPTLKRPHVTLRGLNQEIRQSIGLCKKVN